MDNLATIHARSERLVICLEDYVNGDIDQETVELLIDAEEANADIPRSDFFDSVRKLMAKINA